MNTTKLDQSTPHGLMRCAADRLNAADLDGLVELYEPTAVYEPQPGATVRGRTAIRDALDELLAIKPTIVADTVQVLVAGDTALVINEWQLTGTAPDGTPMRPQGRSTDVVRRQPDGHWLVSIDKP